jgi:murein DD-endopeptidase MepM/ murein hydrolase activator NlpD
MTAWCSRDLFAGVATAVLTATALSGCALGSPGYPIREARAETPPSAAAPVATARDARAAVDTAAQPDTAAPPAPSSSSPVVETAPLPPAGQSAPANAPAPEPAPITEAPSGPGVLPPVNRRPSAQTQSLPPAPPASVPLRSSRLRAPPPPAATRPLVAGRVESVNDLSHVVDVEKGDTVNTISDGLMTPKDSLIRANRLRKPFELEIGQTLKIPVHKVYVVQAGDTLYGISRRFSTPVDVLSDINRIEEKSRLRTGQRVALPDGARDVGPMPGPAEPAATYARADESAPPSREVATADIAPAPAAPYASSRDNAYALPSAPRPYATLGSRPPSRSTYPPAAVAPETAPSVSDSQIQLAGRGRFIWPVHGNLLSGFGPKSGGQRNDGVDIAAPERSAVKAAASGDVVYAGDQIPGFGNLVLIKHEGGWVTAYAHLSASEVKIREHVSQGDEIGQVGQTGGVDQPQLHFEIRYAPSTHDKARPIDPALVLTGLTDE